MKKPSVVVTGAGGFIGSNLVEFLKGKGHFVRAVDIEWPGYRKELFGQADQIWTRDLRSYEVSEDALEDVDWVVHLAADHGGAGYFYSDYDWRAAQNNSLIDASVRDAFAEDQRLFFASSACTYPIEKQGKGSEPLKESDWGGGEAEQLYGETKRHSTLMFEGMRDHGYDTRSGVFHTIYGPYQEYEGIRAKFPTAIARKVYEEAHTRDGGRPGSLIEIWGDGTQRRTFLYIEDALEKIYRVMTKPYEGIVNIGSDESVSIKECADILCEHAGIEPEYQFNEDQPTGVDDRASDNTEFNRLYGKIDQTSAKDGFIKTYKWVKGE